MITKLYNIIIRNGYVIDGTGTQRYKSDIGVADGSIKKIGKINRSANIVIDAIDKIVCPGFIDIHSHSDYTLLANPKAESKIRQGVTTEIGGNCGSSAGPIMSEEALQLVKEDIGIFCPGCKLEINWTTLDEYFRKLEESGISLNFACHVGLNQIRASVVGLEDKEATNSELTQMCELVSEAIDDGAAGLSMGYPYIPGAFIRKDELIELCKIVARKGGIFAPHIRSFGDRLFDAVSEAITISKKVPIPLEIAHLKVTGRKNWGNGQRIIEIIEKARRDGIDVTCDMYPYDATWQPLDTTTPKWARDGGVERFLERIRDCEMKKKIISDMDSSEDYWGGRMIASIASEKNKALEGKMILQEAKKKGLDPREFVLNLILEEKD